MGKIQLWMGKSCFTHPKISFARLKIHFTHPENCFTRPKTCFTHRKNRFTLPKFNFTHRVIGGRSRLSRDYGLRSMLDRLTALRARPCFRARRAEVLGGFRLMVAVGPVGGHRRMARQDGRSWAGIPGGCGRRAKSAGRARSGLARGSCRRKWLAARVGLGSLGWVAVRIAPRAAGCSGMDGCGFPAGMGCPRLAGSLGCWGSGFGFRVGCRNYRMGGSLGC